MADLRRFSPRTFPALPWIIAWLFAAAFIGASDYSRARRVMHVTQTAQDDAPQIDSKSVTGYAQGKRWLVVPEHHNATFQWIEETQLMVARGGWRLRQIDYENAPIGREVHQASLYRWWIVLLARVGQAISGQPIGLCIEQASLWADPILHLLLLGVAVPFSARYFGGTSGILTAIGLAAIYPFSASFLPGVLKVENVVHACAIGSLMSMCAAMVSSRRPRWLMFCGGLIGGIGLWTSASEMIPMIPGIFVGALLAVLLCRRNPGDASAAVLWRLWSLGGALGSLLGFLAEYYPAGMELRLEVNHPLYGIAWLGLGEVLATVESWRTRRTRFPNAVELFRAALAAIAVFALPAVMFWQRTFPQGEFTSNRLTNESDGIVAANLLAWFGQGGSSSLALVATLFPLLCLGPIIWAARRVQRVEDLRASCIAFGAMAVVVSLAVSRLHYWTLASGLFVCLLVTLPGTLGFRRLRTAIYGFGLVFGFICVSAKLFATRSDRFSHWEVEQFYERMLAHWMIDHAAPERPVVLAPPFRTPSFCFFGGLRGLGTQNWENRDGLGATLRIVGATRADEALAILNERQVTYVVLPSWDQELIDLGRLAVRDEKDAFVYQLAHSTVFEWIRPIPFRLPKVEGVPDATVALVQVVEPSNRAIAISRLTEYFLEMEMPEVAEYGSRALREFPSDLGALIAIAQVEKARNNRAEFDRTLASIIANLSSGADRFLPWSRRVNLVVVLALGGRQDLAKAQLERVWKDVSPAKLRSLTTGELYRLLVLAKAYGLAFADPKLTELSRSLLPAEFRERL